MKSENIIQTNLQKKRGRPRNNIVKNDIDFEAKIKQLEETLSNIKKNSFQTSNNLNSSSEFQEPSKITYDFHKIFKHIKGLDRVIEYKIKNYTKEDLQRYIDDPIRYSSQLIDINHYMYNTNGFFREFIDFLVQPILYRWTVDTSIKNISFYEQKNLEKFHNKLKKDFLTFVGKVNSLGLEKEFKRIILKMCLEDVVYGYWLDDGDNSTIYYLPASWCVIRNKMNGLWNYSIDSRKVSPKDIDEVLPKEIASLIKKHKGKPGDDAYAIVPYEKSVCYKFNDHLDYSFPPFTYIILAIIRLMKLIEVSDAKDELDAMNLIGLEIPVSTKDGAHDDLLLTADTVAPFVEVIKSVVSELVGVLVAPMKMYSIPLSQTQSVDKKMVKNAIESYQEESNMPSFGGANTAGELKKSLENSTAKIFTLYDQISNGINLKLKLEGYIYPSYDFNFNILHINKFNKVEVQDSLLKQAQSGLFVKMNLAASFGMNPSEYLGQSYIENILFRDVINNATVFPTAFTQSGATTDSGGGSTGKGVGRPALPDELAAPSTIQARESQENVSIE